MHRLGGKEAAFSDGEFQRRWRHRQRTLVIDGPVARSAAATIQLTEVRNGKVVSVEGGGGRQLQHLGHVPARLSPDRLA